MIQTKSKRIPATIPGRLTLVGRTIYGKSFRARLAVGLKISRSTLFEWMRTSGTRRDGRDIDAELIDLLDSERGAAIERSIAIEDLRQRFIEKVRKHAA